MKILVAEDDPVTQRILQITLEQAGHTVLMCSDGAEAWKTLIGHPVECIVSDWMMPIMDGLELCRKVRARRRKDYIYFIMLTARVGSDNHQTAIDAGVDDFLTKPLRHQELRIRLRVAERILTFMRELRQLRELLPICSYCKKIRDDQDYWHQMESYIQSHTAVDFSHSICPDCYERVVKPQLEALDKETGET